ncbi:hypothetical protein [Sandaracinus amylolyticus]|uniref:hypothetical protein n=1 Tax=Sandaracinus amylolyticus TaxID=927083 RepID=UPI001F302ACB|nr:hypothetical protein [Sandaracinus amylolyticus]UJR87179.1 Hypothetical protein I5071_92800 [Sandaracinus amylolyticus]
MQRFTAALEPVPHGGHFAAMSPRDGQHFVAVTRARRLEKTIEVLRATPPKKSKR